VAQVDVFVSWTRHAAPLTADGSPPGGVAVSPQDLVAALARAGVSAWIDEQGIEAFDPIPDRVRTALSEAKVMVAWYSAGYPTRRACREELTLALLAAERSGAGGARRVLVVNPEPDATHVVEAALLESRFAGPPDLADLDALAARIADRVARVDIQFGELARLNEPVRWYGGEGWRGQSTEFVGRLDTLWAVHDRLTRASGLTGPGQAGRALALVSGLGGVGKSLLAAEYAHLFATAYPGGIVWHSAPGNPTTPVGEPPNPGTGSGDTEDTDPAGGAPSLGARSTTAADAGFAALAVQLGLAITGHTPAEIRAAVTAELDARGERVLWVVDDLPTGLSPAQVDAWRCPAAAVRELITTRDQTHTRLDPLRLDVLPAAEAALLITTGRTVNPAEQAEALALATDLGGHPLACAVAGRYIATSSTITGYRAMLAGDLTRFDTLTQALSDQLPGGHAAQISATLATSLHALQADTWPLLRAAALLAATPIPRSLLHTTYTIPADPSADAPPMDDQLAEQRLGRSLNDGHRDGLWSYDPGTAAVTVHALVRATAALLDPHPQATEPLRRALIDDLDRLIRSDMADARRHPAIAPLTVHARHLTDQLEATTDPQQQLALARLLGALDFYDWVGGRYPDSLRAATRAHAAYRRLLGDEHPDTLAGANNLAETLRDLGDYPAARDLHQSTYDTYRRLLGADHPNTLTSASNLAVTLHALGDDRAARDLHQSTYDIRRRVLGEDHSSTLASANNLADTLRTLGDYQTARELHQTTYDTCRRVLGEDHPDTLTSANNLAGTLYELGDVSAARDSFQSTYDTRRRVLGADHPDTLISANNLAGTLYELGDVSAARDLFQSTYDTFHRVLGADHPDTLISATNVALTRWDFGQRREAVTLLDEILGRRTARDPNDSHIEKMRSTLARWRADLAGGV
jgi:Tetratricopeptide repeat/TIR domain